MHVPYDTHFTMFISLSNLNKFVDEYMYEKKHP